MTPFVGAITDTKVSERFLTGFSLRLKKFVDTSLKHLALVSVT